MSAIFPIIGPITFHKHIILAAKELQTYMKDFESIFKHVPDERGLTDQLLYKLYKSLVENNEGAGTKIEYTGKTESENGADYILRFSTRNPQTSIVENREIWIQAKSWKDGEALFTQKVTKVGQNTRLQMDLLQEAVTRAQKDNVIVYGGYLVYGTSGDSDDGTMKDIGEAAAKEKKNPDYVDGIDFFPIEDVVKKYKEVVANRANVPAYIKALNKYFWDNRAVMDYTLVKLVDWK